MKYKILENLDFYEKQPKTSGFIDFSISNIQISHADACVRCCVGSWLRIEWLVELTSPMYKLEE